MTARAVHSVTGWRVWELPEPLRSYVVSATTLAGILSGIAVLNMAWRTDQFLVFIGCVACGILSIEATRKPSGLLGLAGKDMQAVWYLAVAVTLPPAYAMLAPILTVAYQLGRVRGGVLFLRVFSIAAKGLAYGAADVAFREMPRTLGGLAPGSGVHVLTWTALVAGCCLISEVVKGGLLFAATRLCNRATRARDWYGTREAVTADLLVMSLAVSLALVVAIDPPLMALAVPSVILCGRYLLRAQLSRPVRVTAVPHRKKRVARRPSRSARRFATAAARLLPPADRSRYAEEYASELWEMARERIPRWIQMGHALRLLASALRLRAELSAPNRRKA